MSLRKFLILGTSLSALSAAAWGVRCAVLSPMFLLQVVEVAEQSEVASGPGETALKSSPVDAQAVAALAAVPVGKINLFELDLKPIETRILANTWIREVRLQKHFPQTLSISVVFRTPQALLQSNSGALSYVDVDGNVFGQVNLMYQPDLPIISASSAGHIQQALKLLQIWETSELSVSAQVSSLQWDAERGFRALVTYPLRQSSSGRTLVDLGQDFDATSETQFKRLSRVFHYLTANQVVARQIWADSGKKIVVRTAHGS